ncbi:MAG: LicD family protein [Thermoactinomyces sp.]
MKLSQETVKQLQKKEFEILREFDKAARKMGLPYTLSSGTLLGAVRHGGFIPWDDDADVAMLREDYERFLKEGQKYLPDYLFIQHYETDPDFPHNFIKLLDTRTVLVEHTTSRLNIKRGVFIDIFPIDRIPDNKIIRTIDRLILAFIYFTKFSVTMQFKKKRHSRLRKIIARILWPLGKAFGTYRLNRWETYIKTRYNHNSKFEYTYGDNSIIIPTELKDSMILPIRIFQDLGEIEFEHHTFLALKERDRYLKTLYGDYMELPPEEQRVCKHMFMELKL